METEANGPFRWIPSTRMSKNDRKVVRSLPFPTPTIIYAVNHFANPPALSIPVLTGPSTDFQRGAQGPRILREPRT